MNKVENCMFCGCRADTREHIIPMWMHKKFEIKHEKLRVRNNTEVKYLHEVMPACAKCNSDRFSPIEERVKNGKASNQDLYVWALKIYVGLNLKDTQLLEDRRNPSKGKVLTKTEAIKGVEFSEEILKYYGREKFSIYPKPFGSIFIKKLPNHVKSTFALSSIGHPYNIITIILDERHLLTVILNDKGLVSKAINQSILPDDVPMESLTEKLTKDDEPLSANSYAKLLTFHFAIQKFRLEIPKGFSRSPKRVAAIRLPKKLKLAKCDDIFVANDLINKLSRINT